jgi:hypothetical protein
MMKSSFKNPTLEKNGVCTGAGRCPVLLAFKHTGHRPTPVHTFLFSVFRSPHKINLYIGANAPQMDSRLHRNDSLFLSTAHLDVARS